MSYLFNGQNIEVMVNGEQILFNAEDVAKALGFVQHQIKNGKSYESIRWETINKHLAKFFPDKLGKGSYIPEQIVYKLAFKAQNETAEEFTDWLAVEVLPSIRKTGGFVQDQREEEFISKMFPSFSEDVKKAMVLDLHKQKKALEAHNMELSQELAIAKPKASYYDSILASDELVKTTTIATDYGIRSARTLNALLHEWKIIFKQGGEWTLYSKYREHKYMKAKPYPDGRTHNMWTQKGRIFLHGILTEKGYTPVADEE
jgi:anti-repressor protein